MVDTLGHNFYDFLKNAYSENGEEVVKQYSLKDGSFFEKHILKKREMYLTDPDRGDD